MPATSQPAGKSSSKSKSSARSTPIGGVNFTILHGECSGTPELRTLPSGGRLASLAVRVPGPRSSSPDARQRRHAAASVPVTVWEPAAWIDALGAGDAIVVFGPVRRRFYRNAAGTTGSRVEVEAEVVVRARDRRRMAALRRRVAAALSALDEVQRVPDRGERPGSMKKQ